MPDYPHRLHLDEIDVIVETDSAPVDLADAAPDEIDRAIAEQARRYVSDGATLQTGIGAIPSLIATLLAEGDGGGYGVHSEMFTTGLMRLHEAGKVTNAEQGRVRGLLGHHLRRRHARAVRVAPRERPGPVPARSTW